MAKFDRDKIGQTSAPPTTHRRDSGAAKPDAGEEEDAGEEPPLEEDAGAEDDAEAADAEAADAAEELDAGEPEDAGEDASLEDAPADDGVIEIIEAAVQDATPDA